MPSPELWVSCKVSEGGWEKREEESGCGIFRSWTCALYLSGNRNISGSWRRQADLSSSGKGRWLWYSSFPLRTVGLDRALMVPLSEDCARNVWICDSNCPKELLQKETLPRRRDSKMVTWGWGLCLWIVSTGKPPMRAYIPALSNEESCYLLSIRFEEELGWRKTINLGPDYKTGNFH